MKRAFLGVLVLACVMTLGACQSFNLKPSTAVALAIGAGEALRPATVTPSVQKTNAAIASASAKIEKYCPILRAISFIKPTDPTTKVAAYLSVAKSTVTNVCDAPPADIVGASILAENAFTDLKSAGLVK